MAPIWTHLNPTEPIRATMAPIWTSTTGPQGSFCRRSTSAWRASCPWRSGDNLRLRVKNFAFRVDNYCYSKFSADDNCGSWRQIIYLELSSGSCTTPRQLLVLSAALSSQTCSGFSKQRRWMHIPFNFIAIVFKTDKDVACFCWC